MELGAKLVGRNTLLRGRRGALLLAALLVLVPLSAGWMLHSINRDSVNHRAAAVHLQTLIADIDSVTTTLAIAILTNQTGAAVAPVIASLKTAVDADLADLQNDMANTGLVFTDIEQDAGSFMVIAVGGVPLLGTAAINPKDPVQMAQVTGYMKQHDALIVRMQERMQQANRLAAAAERITDVGTWTIVLVMSAVLVVILWRAERHRRRIALVKERNAGLLESEARLRAIVDTSLNAVVTMSGDGIVTGWSSQAERTFGWPSDEVIGRRLSDTIIPEQHRAAHERGLERFLATGEGPVLGTVVDITALRRDGSEFPVEVAISLPVGQAADLTFVAFIRDATERRRAESVRAMQASVTRALSDSTSVEEAAPSILDAIGTALGSHVGAIWTVDPTDGRLVLRHSWHAAGIDLARFDAASELLRLNPGDGLPGRVWAAKAPQTADMSTGSTFPRTVIAREAGLVSGAGFPIVADDTVIGVIEFFGQVAREFDDELLDVMADLGRQVGQFMERRRAEGALREHVDRLAAIASTDALTGLKSRREFERTLASAQRERFAILAIDVDNLKEVNDENGHEGGDVVLQAVAMTLSSLLRGWDVVARIGGDEFAAILSGVSGEEAAAVAERLRLAMHSISIPYGTARVSVGWAAGPAGADPHSVRNAADEALYRAKRRGRDRVEGGQLQAGLVTGSIRLREAELVTRVLDEHAMGVAYQPIVELAGRTIVGFEALARPAGYGPTTSVESLFKAARGLGRIRDLDWLCRRAAVESGVSLPEGTSLFINVSSAALLDPNHGVDQLLLLLEWADRRPEDTVLEITEQEVIRDLARLRIVVAAYREHGVRFAIDDVGEGYSTLELLAAANPEFLKIGASLTTSAMRKGPRSAIEAAAAFTRSNGGMVIAEGIEDEATAKLIAGLGIALGQGFWLGRPVVAERPVMRTGRRVGRAAAASVPLF